MRALALTLSLLVLVGCGGPHAYEPQKVAVTKAVTPDELTPKDAIPLQEGNRWTYSYETQTQTQKNTIPEKGELTFEVNRITDKGDGKVATMLVLRDGKQVDKQDWLVNSKGVYQTTALLGGNDIVFNPPQPLMLFPVKDNMTFSWKGKGVCPDGALGTVEADFKVLGPMDADTGMGTKSGIAIESNQTFQSSSNKGGVSVTTWYAPKFGILRIKQTMVVPKGSITTTLRLTKAPA